jgi:hypothetical protein
MLFQTFLRSFDHAADFFSERTIMDFLSAAIIILFPPKKNEYIIADFAYAFVIVFILTAFRQLLKTSLLSLEISDLKSKLDTSEYRRSRARAEDQVR